MGYSFDGILPDQKYAELMNPDTKDLYWINLFVKFYTVPIFVIMAKKWISNCLQLGVVDQN